MLSTGITAQEIRHAAALDLDLSPARPHLHIPKRGPREARRINIDEFAGPALTRWRNLSPTAESPLLFPSPRAGGPMADEMLRQIVRDELIAVDICVPDMSPRTLRNTYARRLLLAGRSNDVTQALWPHQRTDGNLDSRDPPALTANQRRDLTSRPPRY
ncbi:tyrosine-type recombinase/integrase [Burkholderia sp. BCC1630]|uniref:tyrosine-type recombinase/integrase n=1 Tax=Burkholderia sp. BCC1630 TaxID=2676304 RepID=UPI003263A84E